MSLISTLHWIRKGVAARVPTKYEIDDKEFERINALGVIQLQDAKEDLAEARTGESKKAKDPSNLVDPELEKYNLDSYDDELADDQPNVNIFSNIKGLTYYPSNIEDPYITLKGNPNEFDADEREDLEILPTDNLLLAAKTEDDISHLEIYVYEESEENLYVHHDIMLPAFPLCLEWLDFRVGKNAGQSAPGNFVAVGTFDPDIEIWDLDLVDTMYPGAILGAPSQEIKGGSKSKKKTKRSKTPNPDYHTDAVMCLSWNKNHRNILASSSADTTVKLWDLVGLKAIRSFTHHNDKVQSVAWHPIESTVLLTGSYDKTVAAFDSRAAQTVSLWQLDADVECLRWDPHFPEHFFVSTEDGMVRYFDIRIGSSAPLFTLHAHDSAVSAMDVNPLIPGCLVTGSVDKRIKIWDVDGQKPRMVTSRDLDVGKVFSATFCPDSPFQLAVAGSLGQVQIWEMSSNAGVRRAFANRTQLIIPEVEEKQPISLKYDEESESDEEKLGEQDGDIEMVEENEKEEEEDDDESDEDV